MKMYVVQGIFSKGSNSLHNNKHSKSKGGIQFEENF